MLPLRAAIFYIFLWNWRRFITFLCRSSTLILRWCCRSSGSAAGQFRFTRHIDTATMNRTGCCLQIGTDTICRILRYCLCHSLLHCRKKQFHLRYLIRAHAGCQKSCICTDIYDHMMITGLCRHGSFCKIFISHNTFPTITVTQASHCQLA